MKRAEEEPELDGFKKFPTVSKQQKRSRINND